MAPRLVLGLITLTACLFAAVVGLTVARLAGAGEPEGAALPADGLAGAVRPPGARVPGVALADAEGQRVSLAVTGSGPAVLTFVYSTCEDTCPGQVQAIRGALDLLGRDVPVLAVSVDPAGDTPARAKRFVNEQRMTGRMRFLLGTRAELEPVWRAFGIRPQEGKLDHSAYVVLVDGEGRQRVGFPAGGLTPEGLAHDLEALGA